MKKILLFTDSLGAGGAQRQLVGLAVMLKQLGYKVKVCYYHDIPFYKEYLDKNNICHELIPRANSKYMRFISVAFFFRKEQADWVIAYQETPSIIAVIIKLFCGSFQVITSERNTTQVLKRKDRIRFFLYRWADYIVPNSFAQSYFIKMHYPNLSERIVVIPNYVDLALFFPSCHKRREIPEIIIVASLWEPKNAKGFLKACSILKEKGLVFHVTWFGINEGTIPYQEESIAMIKDLDLKDFCVFSPKSSSISVEYRKADYFCLPSFYEGTPNALCEAIASGLPVMCSDVCDNHIYVHPKRNGILFDPLRPEDIADKMQFLMSLPEDEYQLYCKNSRSIAEELLHKELFIDRYISLLN